MSDDLQRRVIRARQNITGLSQCVTTLLNYPDSWSETGHALLLVRADTQFGRLQRQLRIRKVVNLPPDVQNLPFSHYV
ncbi:hypothetical protein ABC733_03025 [Mangrovibacter sp. SLW1]